MNNNKFRYSINDKEFALENFLESNSNTFEIS